VRQALPLRRMSGGVPPTSRASACARAARTGGASPACFGLPAARRREVGSLDGGSNGCSQQPPGLPSTRAPSASQTPAARLAAFDSIDHKTRALLLTAGPHRPAGSSSRSRMSSPHRIRLNPSARRRSSTCGFGSSGSGATIARRVPPAQRRTASIARRFRCDRSRHRTASSAARWRGRRACGSSR